MLDVMCSVADCDKPVGPPKHGLCHMHYWRWRTYGTTDNPKPEWHRLSDRDTESMTATCQVCGPNTPMRYKPNRNRYICRPNNPTRPPGRGPRRKKTKAGTTPESRTALLEAQGGVCVICQRVPKQACQDHCHKTGTVRGVLCLGCNKGLGFFYDSPEMLEVAAAYLRSYQ